MNLSDEISEIANKLMVIREELPPASELELATFDAMNLLDAASRILRKYELVRTEENE